MPRSLPERSHQATDLVQRAFLWRKGSGQWWTMAWRRGRDRQMGGQRRGTKDRKREREREREKPGTHGIRERKEKGKMRVASSPFIQQAVPGCGG